MSANRTETDRERLRRREEMERRIVRGGADDVRGLQRRIERGRPNRSRARAWAVGKHAPPPSGRVATSEWELARTQAVQATYRRIRAAIRAAAAFGEESVLSGSTELSADAALAYAKECLPFEGGGTVDVTLDGPVLLIRPRHRRYWGSAFD